MATATARNRDVSDAERKGWRPRQLAKAMGLAPATLYNEIAIGNLGPVWRFGKSIVVPQASVDRWLESKSTGDTAAGSKATPPPNVID